MPNRLITEVIVRFLGGPTRVGIRGTAMLASTSAVPSISPRIDGSGQA
jgi:hypothetical protein